MENCVLEYAVELVRQLSVLFLQANDSCWKTPTAFCVAANGVLQSLFFYIISICCTIFSPWLYKTWGGAVWLCFRDMDIFVRIHHLFIYLVFFKTINIIIFSHSYGQRKFVPAILKTCRWNISDIFWQKNWLLCLKI